MKEVVIPFICQKNTNNPVKDEISDSKNAENVNEIKALKEKLDLLKNDTNKIL